jgi:chemotaxis protein methyltransferase CheR
MSAMAREGVRTVSAFQDRVLHDAACMQRFLGSVGVNVTTMFRDPELMQCIREEVVPLLKTYPSYRVWVAGCASGEEVYSLSILLNEAGMLERGSIYATDLNEDMLAVARLGAYPLERVRRYEEAYQMSGGQGSLSDYYTAGGRTAHFNRDLLRSITWARHNLVTDGSFNDFHLIVCANVLIYFRPSLQERAHRLFYDSLIRGGFLALGKRESLLHSPDHDHYEQVRDGVSLYRKMRW